MRAGYQTVPSSRVNATRRRGQRLRNRNQANPMAHEHSTQSQESLASPRPPPSQIPRPSEGCNSLSSKLKAEQSQSTKPKSVPEAPPQAIPEQEAEHQKRQETSEIPSPSTVKMMTVEPVTARESSGDSLSVDNNTTAENSMPPVEPSTPAEGNEHSRAVSCTSTVFYDAPALASQSDLIASIEKRSEATVMPSLDGLINSTDQKSPPETGPEPERPTSSDYSNPATLASSGSPASPTNPRSPSLAPEALREELSSDIETMRQRLFSESSDMFRSSTWDGGSQLDLAGLGRGGKALADGEARHRVSSEESTVIEGNRSVHLVSRVASVNDAKVNIPAGRTSGQAARTDAPVHWHDGPSDASAAASGAHPLGPRPSVTETSTITSTQAIKSRTFSSGNESVSSGLRGSGDRSSRTGDGAASVKNTPSTAEDPEKNAGTGAFSATTADGPASGENERGPQPFLNPLPAVLPVLAAVGLALVKVLTFCLPIPIALHLARKMGLIKKKEETGENENEAEISRSQSRLFWRRRGNNSGPRRKRFWRVRMPWGRRRDETPPLLAGGSTDG